MMITQKWILQVLEELVNLYREFENFSKRDCVISTAVSEMDLNSPLNYGTPSSLSSLRTPRSAGRATPMHKRPDVKSDRKVRQVNLAGPNEVKFQCDGIYSCALITLLFFVLIFREI